MKNSITKSWKINAAEWIKVIDANQIASRVFTNKAIVEVLQNSKSKKIIDIGCGEGWLTREITQMGKKAIGIDTTADLLINARTKGKEAYYQMNYEEISQGKTIPNAPFDAAVFNFSIYQNEELPPLLKAVKNMLSAHGEIIIQTLHPFFLIQNQLAYKSQWINDSWKGLPGNFKQDHKWYARTMADWTKLLKNNDLILSELIEVTPKANIPISVIFKTRIV